MCRFKSCHPHQKIQVLGLGFFIAPTFFGGIIKLRGESMRKIKILFSIHSYSYLGKKSRGCPEGIRVNIYKSIEAAPNRAELSGEAAGKSLSATESSPRPSMMPVSNSLKLLEI